MESKKNALFHEITTTISEGTEIEDSLYETFVLLKKFIPLDEININFFDPNLNAIHMISQATTSGAQKKDIALPLSLNSKVSREISVMKGVERVRIYNRPERFPISTDWAHFLGETNASHIALHLFSGMNHQELGALNMSVEGKDKFSADHARIVFSLRAPFTIFFKNALQRRQIELLKDQLIMPRGRSEGETSRESHDQVLCLDSGLFEVMEQIRKVASLECTVLLLGETGVGKEVIANTIHSHSSRKNGPFVKINCGAIPDSLLDSEFFGHEKGSFTGATSRIAGHFERAHKGTILLDEIGELTPQGQIRLLRVFDQKRIRRVGGSDVIPVDVRIVAATNRDLKAMVSQNQFREDLWYRLNVFPIFIPPLRDRKKDIPIFADYFLTHLSQEIGLKSKPQLSRKSMAELMSCDWPGNVRQLKNTLERSLILNPSGPLNVESILHQERFTYKRQPVCQGPHPRHLDDVVQMHIERILEETNGKIYGPGGAADLLGVNPNTLRNKMDKLGIAYRRKSRRHQAG